MNATKTVALWIANDEHLYKRVEHEADGSRRCDVGIELEAARQTTGVEHRDAVTHGDGTARADDDILCVQLRADACHVGDGDAGLGAVRLRCRIADGGQRRAAAIE